MKNLLSFCAALACVVALSACSATASPNLTSASPTMTSTTTPENATIDTTAPEMVFDFQNITTIDNSVSPSFDGIWILQLLTGVSQTPGNIDLQFDDNNLYGTDGCNRFFGTYTPSHTAHVKLNLSGSTMMGCLEPNVNAFASQYTAALDKVASWRFDGHNLVLLEANQNIIATYARQDITLEGTKWMVTGVNDGKMAIYSDSAVQSQSLQFSDTGEIMGFAGCNQFRGKFEYTNTVGELKLIKIGSTRMACLGDVAAAEHHLLRALENTTHYERRGESLVLRSSQGTEVTLRAAP